MAGFYGVDDAVKPVYVVHQIGVSSETVDVKGFDADDSVQKIQIVPDESNSPSTVTLLQTRPWKETPKFSTVANFNISGSWFLSIPAMKYVGQLPISSLESIRKSKLTNMN